MSLRLIIMAMAAALVLAFIWRLGHRTSVNRRNRPARGVADEAAGAFEDVAREFIDGNKIADSDEAKSNGERPH